MSIDFLVRPLNISERRYAFIGRTKRFITKKLRLIFSIFFNLDNKFRYFPYTFVCEYILLYFIELMFMIFHKFFRSKGLGDRIEFLGQNNFILPHKLINKTHAFYDLTVLIDLTVKLDR